MRRFSRALIPLLLVATLILPAAALADSGVKSGASPSALAATVQNDLIRINMGDEGKAVVFTTGGDPDIAGDENKHLLYTYQNADTGLTSVPSMRVTRDGATQDFTTVDVDPSNAPRVDGKAVVVQWEMGGVRLTYRVSLAPNPFTGREDMARFAVTLTNTGDSSCEAGARILLDLKIGTNDEAPILVPGMGGLDTETELGGASYYRAFESPTYVADSLRALGIIRGHGLTDPDRVVLASWNSIFDSTSPWDYAITSGRHTSDSAMAYWWNPVSLDPGESVTYDTLYGLGAGGGSTWFDAPTDAGCGDGAFSATLWVSNASPFELAGGQTTLTLPAGLTLADGSTTFAFPNVPAAAVASVTISLVADTSAPTQFAYSASTTFDDTPEPLVANATIDVPDCTEPTPVPTPKPTDEPDDEPSEVPEPGSLTLLALGLGGLAAAWRRRRSR